MRDSHEGGDLRSCGDKHRSSGFRLEIGSKLKEPSELSVMTGHGGVGERAKRGAIQGMLAKPPTVPTFSAAVPFVPRPGQKNGALENRRAQGSFRGPWQWETQCCHSLN